MLSGDNGILQKATDAKTQTGIGQEKEIVTLAYNSALAKKVSNGDSTAVTCDELDDELNSSNASAKNDNPIIVTFVTSKRQYKVNNNGIVDYIGIRNNKSLSLKCTQIETESRAVILNVSVEGIPTVEEWLAGLGTTSEGVETLKEMFARKMTNGYATWDVACSGLANVEEWWNQRGNGYGTNAYNFMVLQGWYDSELYNDTYPEVTVNCNNEKGTIDFINKTFAEFVIPNCGDYTITASNKNGDTGTIITKINKENEEIYSDIQQNNYKLSKEGYEIWIPAGFAYGTSSNVGTVTKGLVITDAVDSNHYSTGNEFVWIPVDKTNLTVGTTNKVIAKIKSESESSGNIDYEGVFYNIDGNNGVGSSKEPGLHMFENENKLAEIGLTTAQFEKKLQEDYNAVIASIKLYGGFYVARYEMGEEKNYSKLGVIPMTGDDGTGSIRQREGWYPLYIKASAYTNEYNKVKSSMIWGSLYDAMMNYALSSGDDSDKVNSFDYGNVDGTLLKTGTTQKKDKINNIFDLGGNLFEYTIEAHSDDRTGRGGYYKGKEQYNWRYKPSSRSNMSLGTTANQYSTRVVLYIE